MSAQRHRVVVVGGGFGGLQAALGLRDEAFDVTLIDRRNFHLFQPLTYQVATGALSPAEVAYPLRTIFRRRPNVRVLMAEVSDFDLAAHAVRLESVAGEPAQASIPYDTLVVAGGSRYSYFGRDEWREFAAEVKSLESAIAVRGRLLRAFERAEAEPDTRRKEIELTFAVIGAGPTGVEMAGQIAELARETLRREFRSIDPRTARILLIEAADRVLTTFPPSLSAKAERFLRKLGVTVLTDRMVVALDSGAVTVEDGAGSSERIEAGVVVWAAGVTAEGLAGRLAALTGAETDRAGRVTVEQDLTLRGHPEVFALGDMVRICSADGIPVALPGVAPVAMQQGRYVAKTLRRRSKDRSTPPFRYHDKGNLATIGRAAAVADLGRVRLSGFAAWATWLVVHLWYLIGFQNRLLVLVRWSISFFTRGRGARLITNVPAEGHDPRIERTDRIAQERRQP